ncbi:MAG: type IV pilin protein [Gammaproteobacteria bacterium]
MRRAGKPERQTGFTLVEILTAVVIAVVLVAVAIPAYTKHVARARRSEAVAALLQLQAEQQKFYLQHNRYTEEIAAPTPTGLGLPARTASGRYVLVVALGTNPSGSGDQSYTATANAVATRDKAVDTECTTFILTDSGKRGATGTANVRSCWR